MRRASTSIAVKAGVVATAIGVAVAPRPAWMAERLYAAWFYPLQQSVMTAASNRVPVALFDVAIVAAALAAGVGVWRSVHRARKARSIGPVLSGLASVLACAAAVYLWFVLAWGLNYARSPIETRVAFDRRRVTPAAVRGLAERAVSEANRTHARAHAAGFPAGAEVPAALVDALHEVERRLGRPRPTVPAVPKTSMLSPFFRRSGVSGMIGPFFLETIVNPDLTGPERPFVIAHEWAHLSGFAPEAEASYVAFVAAVEADVSSQYSAWLEMALVAAAALPAAARDEVLAGLDGGPAADREAIRRRLSSLVRPVERAAWRTYDRLLKAQGVDEGVASYGRVVELVVGSGAVRVGG